MSFDFQMGVILFRRLSWSDGYLGDQVVGYVKYSKYWKDIPRMCQILISDLKDLKVDHPIFFLDPERKRLCRLASAQDFNDKEWKPVWEEAPTWSHSGAFNQILDIVTASGETLCFDERRALRDTHIFFLSSHSSFETISPISEFKF